MGAAGAWVAPGAWLKQLQTWAHAPRGLMLHRVRGVRCGGEAL